MPRMSAADFHEFATVSEPSIAPDGTVAFLRRRPETEEEYDITIYGVGPGEEAAPLTIEDGIDAEPRWSPSGDRLAFVSTRADPEDRTQLWILPAAGGEARQVTEVIGGVSNIAWSPDGSRIAFTQHVRPDERAAGHDLVVAEDYEREDPDPRVIDRLVYRADASYFDGATSQVYVANLEKGTVERVTDADLEHVAPTWGDAGTVYYAVKRDPEAIHPDASMRYDIDAVDIETEAVETVADTTGWEPRLAATTDGRLAVTRTPEERASMRQTEIDVIDRATGDRTAVTADLDRDLAQLPIRWGPDETDLYFATPDEGSVVVRRVPGDGNSDTTVIAGAGAHVNGFAVGEDRVVATQSEADYPGDVFAYSVGDGEAGRDRLTHLNHEFLAERPLATPEEISYESEGETIQGWVFTPPAGAGEPPYPLVVEVHGGPHAMWSPSGTMFHEFQTLAANGYAVFASNPRGSVGYGEDVAMAIDRNWGAVTATDVLAGVEEVVRSDDIDGEECFLTGGSFGGFMAGWLVGQTDRFEAAVAQRGVFDLSSFYGSTDAFKLIEGDFDTTPNEDPSFLWDQSPVASVPDVDTPTLVIHAENDFRVPINNGEMFYLLLRKAGVESRLVRYPREGHELSRSGEPGHVVDRIERIRRWFDGYSSRTEVPPAVERDPGDGLETSPRPDVETGD